MTGEVPVSAVPDEGADGQGTAVPASRRLDPQELQRMAQRLRQVDELSQFLVAMRDAVRADHNRT